MTTLDKIAAVLAVFVAIDLAFVGYFLRLGRVREKAAMRRRDPVEDIGPIRRDLPRDRSAA